MEGNEILPNIDHLIKQVVEPSFPQTNDDTERIQNALDWVGNLPIDPSSGFRGIVQLGQGTYRISRPLELHVSGVILQGIENGGTVLENIGNENHLIRISGKPNELAKKRAPIVDDYIPVGSTELNVNMRTDDLKRGDTVVVAVNFNAAWIKAIGMDIIHPKGDTTKNNGWKPGRFEHLRRILDVKGDKVVLNSPITTRLEQCYGGGYVEIYTSHRIQKVGIQYLTLLDPRNAQRTKEIIMKNEKK